MNSYGHVKGDGVETRAMARTTPAEGDGPSAIENLAYSIYLLLIQLPLNVVQTVYNLVVSLSSPKEKVDGGGGGGKRNNRRKTQRKKR
jgi:hypothetical protein